MPQWAGSSWYFLRYMDPHNQDALASKEALEYWSPVDWYNGGMEHTTLHLLYSRFWHKFLYDIGVVPTAEPYQKRTSHGMILGLNPHNFANLPADEQKALLEQYGNQKAAERALEEKYGEMARHPVVKMSKSLGNVVNPDDVVAAYGADTMRLYEMFMGDFEQAAPWQTSAHCGLQPLFGPRLGPVREAGGGRGLPSRHRDPDAPDHQEGGRRHRGPQDEHRHRPADDPGQRPCTTTAAPPGPSSRPWCSLLNPFAPHMTEELWEKLGHTHDQQLAYYPWPAYDEAKCVEATVEIAVQVNGQGQGAPDRARPTSPPTTPSPRPKPSRRWPPPWPARPWSRRSTSRDAWSIWRPRAEKRPRRSRRFHELLRNRPGKTLIKRLTETPKMRYTVSVSYSVTTKFPPHGPREG